MSDQWYDFDDHRVTLMRFMAESAEYSKDDMAYATEKPWKFEQVFYEAQAAADLEAKNAPETAKLMLNATYGKRKLAEETEQARKIRAATDELYQTDLTPEEIRQAKRDMDAIRAEQRVPDDGDDVVSVDVADLGPVSKYDARSAYPSTMRTKAQDHAKVQSEVQESIAQAMRDAVARELPAPGEDGYGE